MERLNRWLNCWNPYYLTQFESQIVADIRFQDHMSCVPRHRLCGSILDIYSAVLRDSAQVRAAHSGRPSFFSYCLRFFDRSSHRRCFSQSFDMAMDIFPKVSDCAQDKSLFAWITIIELRLTRRFGYPVSHLELWLFFC